jgi:surface carbohydrate biosynthesis protein
MTASTAKLPLILPVETQVREMDGKLLLACVAAERGHCAYIGFQNEIRARIGSIPPGVFIAKGFASRKARFLRIMKRLGFIITAWDEEGLVHPAPEIYAKRRISAESLSFLDGVFSWGADYTALLKGLPAYDGTPIHQIGNPRLDLLRPEASGYYAKDVAALRARFGGYILFNSNFGRVNSAVKRRRDEGVAGPGGNDPALDRQWLEGMEYRKTLYERFRTVLALTAERFPDRQIVLRPHPAERIESWNDISDRFPNLHVLFEGNVIPWLLGADILVHNGCTTAIESVLMGKPVICYQPIPAKSKDWELPNSVSHEAVSDEALITMLDGHLSGGTPLAVSARQRATLDPYVDSRVDRLSTDRIIDVIEDMPPPAARAGFLTRLAGHAGARIRSAEKRLRALLPGDIYSPWHQRKQFPDLEPAAVNAMIGRFRAATGRFGDVEATGFARNVFRISRAGHKA